jgi:O-antigen ligase
LLAPQELYDRITLGWGSETKISASKTDELSAGRVYIWESLAPDIPRNLVTGGGVNSILWSPAVRTGEINLMTHPHNAYLHTLMDYGLLGGALLILFFRRLYKQWVACSQDEQLSPLMRGFFKGVSASFVGYLFFAFTSAGVLPESDQFFLWASMGILFGMLARTRAEQQGENRRPLEKPNMVPRYGTVS